MIVKTITGFFIFLIFVTISTVLNACAWDISYEKNREKRKMKNSIDIKEAERIAKEKGIERILESNHLGDCVEVVGKEGGDTITLRVYDEDRVYER